MPLTNRAVRAIAAAAVPVVIACGMAARQAAARDDVYDVATTYQTIDHFGASDAWIAQAVGTWSNAAARNQIADLLFRTDTGIGLSGWRFNIGAGIDPSVTDPLRTTETFETAQDQYDWTRQAGQRWFLEAAKARGVPKFLADVYSPTMRMTKNGHVYCDATVGTTNLKTGYEQQYAKYLVDVLKHFQDNPAAAQRVSFDYLSPVNEPQWDWNTNSQEGNRASIADIKSWASAISAELQNQGVNTQLAMLESGQIQDMYGGKNYLSNLLGDASIRPKLDGHISYHSYFSDNPSSQLIQTRQSFANAMAQYPGVQAWQTEYCILGSNGPGRDLTMTTALNVARVIHYDLSVANVSAWNWWLAMSPHDYKDGLLYVDLDNQTFTTSKTFWALGNYSRFIRPGAKRISFAGDNSNATGLLASAYRDDLTKRLAVVYVNQTSDAQSVRPIFNGASAYKADYFTPYVTSDAPGDDLKKYTAFNSTDSYDLPARSVVTLVSGTLDEDNTGKTLRRLQGSANYTLGGGVLALSPGDGRFGGVLSGAGGIAKDGSGATQVLTGNNTYSGPTIIAHGTLSLAGANLSAGRIAAASPVTVSSGGTLSIDGFNALGGFTIANIPTVTVNAGGVMTTGDDITCNLGTLALAGGTLAGGIPNGTWGNWTINRDVHAMGAAVSMLSAPRAQLRAAQTFNVDPGSELRVTGSLEDLGGGTGALVKAGAGTLVLLGANSYTAGTTVSAGTLVISHSAALGAGSLSVADGAAAIVASPSAPTMTAINVQHGGVVDVRDGAMIVDYAGVNSPIDAIRAAIASGFAGGAWTGHGINSSTAAGEAGSAHKTAVGYAEAADVGLAGGSFAGQPVDSTAVLVRYTYMGDANVDGKVDTLDFNALAANFGGTANVWSQADFNFDGVVDTLDFNNLAANFGQQLAVDSSSAELGSMIPEPMALLPLSVIAAALTLRRRRRSQLIEAGTEPQMNADQRR